MWKAGLALVKLLFSKSAPYVLAILGVGLMLWVAYTKGEASAENKATVERLTADNAALREVIQKQRTAIEADNKVASEQSQTIVELQTKTEELISRVQSKDATCLDADDANRMLELWDIWKDKR